MLINLIAYDNDGKPYIKQVTFEEWLEIFYSSD